ncbi:sterol desaturase family protein [Saprospiraceae bacterium]|nr:sterol desaturase family protein [Saprospiraceae bacterium]MDC3209951.1 sterol desaturase family protein [Saprospiraceae bacterium]
MEAYATALTYAIPGFVLMVIIEAIAAKIMGQTVNRAMDTISSLSSGMTNTLKNLLGLSVVLVTYGWMESRFGIFEIQSTGWLFFIAFLGTDFASYWSHRFNHSINIFWNRHIVHHSSEEYNLSCALRQEISAIVGIYFFLYIPLAIIGIPQEIILVTAPIHLFAQFWYHTRLIGKMGFLEKILMTPSHHRVHHAINDIYIDKNFSAIFILWDKWFGTFQEELEEETPVYGTLKPANTWNPVLINYQHAWQILKDAWRTNNWLDRIRIWFMPTGWRPKDVQEKYPIIIEGVHTRSKYNSNASDYLKGWSWFQLIFHNLLMYFLLTQFGKLDVIDIMWYSIFLFVSVFSYTTLMDRHIFAIPAEIIKSIIGVWIIYQIGTWYNLEDFFSGGTILITMYLGISLSLTFYFIVFEKIRNEKDISITI